MAPEGKPKIETKDFSQPMSKNLRFFPPEGKPKVEKRIFHTHGQKISDFVPPEGKPKVEKMTFQTQGRKIRDFVPPEGKPKVDKRIVKPYSLKFSGQVKENTRGEGTLSFLVVNSVFGNRGALFLVSFLDVIS